MSCIPKYKTKRLLLKEVMMIDASSYKKHFVDYDVIRNLSYIVPWPYPEDGVKDFLKNIMLPNQGKNRWSWGIFMQNNPKELIGCIDLWKEGKPEHRGFWLGKEFWNKGIMTEAVYPVVDFAFTEIGFEYLIFANAVGNTRSRKIKEKTGCELIGTQSAKFVDPKLTEQELWKLTQQKWGEHKKRFPVEYTIIK